MRYIEIIGRLTEAKPARADYLALGLDGESADLYMRAKVPPKTAAYFANNKVSVEQALRDIEHSRKIRLRHEREARQDAKLVQSLPDLARGAMPITHDQACALIADDDELFDALDTFVGHPDWFEDHPAMADRLRSLLQRMKPVSHSPLFRGQCGFSEERHGHKRGFHSWSLNQRTADYFWKDCGWQGGQLLQITVPVKGVELGHVGTWRMRLRQGENHYLGSQSEWLVLDGHPCKVLATVGR